MITDKIKLTNIDKSTLYTKQARRLAKIVHNITGSSMYTTFYSFEFTYKHITIDIAYDYALNKARFEIRNRIDRDKLLETNNIKLAIKYILDIKEEYRVSQQHL